MEIFPQLFATKATRAIAAKHYSSKILQFSPFGFIKNVLFIHFYEDSEKIDSLDQV
jgi:hypothetical protein